VSSRSCLGISSSWIRWSINVSYEKWRRGVLPRFVRRGWQQMG
jgi:hypothetical protein